MRTVLTDSDCAVARSTPMFSALSPAAFDVILSHAEVRCHARHEMLFEQDDEATEFYLVLEGWTKLSRMTAGGDEAVVGIFRRGDCFGEAPCLSGGRYPVSAQTVTEARLMMLPARRIIELVRAQPEIGLSMLASTSLHLRRLVDQIEELKARTGAQRLAEFLIGLAPIDEGPCTIALPYEKLLIAGSIGIKPESLSRAFQRIRPVGVRISQNMVVIRDVAALAEFAGRERATVLRCPAYRSTCGRAVAR